MVIEVPVTWEKKSPRADKFQQKDVQRIRRPEDKTTHKIHIVYIEHTFTPIFGCPLPFLYNQR